MRDTDSLEKDFSYEKIIATAANTTFAPWLLNLLGSINTNYPDHPPIIVYDLGLSESFLKELRGVKNVHIKGVPAFVPHYRACYTWKPWVLNDVPAKLTFYIDSASEVLKPLDEVFKIIDELDYFITSQNSFGDTLDKIVSPDLLLRANLPFDFAKNKEYFWAGGFGYKKNTLAHKIVLETLKLAMEGWTLGWSKSEEFRNNGFDHTNITRNCDCYRHDQSILNVLFYKNYKTLTIQEESIYARYKSKSLNPKQVIWASRRMNKKLKFISKIKYNKKPYIRFYNRIKCFFIKLTSEFKYSPSNSKNFPKLFYPLKRLSGILRRI